MSQKLYQQELEEIERWWERCGFDALKHARKSLAQSYFLVAPAMFEPQFSSFRLAYTKNVVLATLLDDFFDDETSDLQQLRRFNEAFTRWDPSLIDDLPLHKLLFQGIDATCQQSAAESNRIQGGDVLPTFKHLWAEFSAASLKEAEWTHSKHIPSYEEYIKTAAVTSASKLMTWASTFLLGEKMTDEMLSHIGPDSRFMYLVCVVCRLSNDVVTFEREIQEGKLASGVGCYMRDHPGCTQEEAQAGLVNFLELAEEELEWELYLSRAVMPEFCSRAVLNGARNTAFLYKRMDALTNCDEELMKLFQDFAFNPVA